MGTREDRLTEAIVLDRLKRRGSPWSGNGWMVIPHVRIQTGWTYDFRRWSDIKTRKVHSRLTEATIDALAINAWPSRGNEIHGLEIKLSRADWLCELRDPVKSEVMRRQVDKMFVVAPAGVVRPDLDADVLGKTWGYYEFNPEHDWWTFKKKFNCPKLPGSVGVELPRAFVTAIIRADLKQKGK